MRFRDSVHAEVGSILKRFGPSGVALVSLGQQAEDLYRVHFGWNGLDFHHVLDEQGLSAFVLELSQLVELDETKQPGVIRAALAAMNRLHSRLHYVRCVLVPVDDESSTLFAVGTGVETARRAMGWLIDPLPSQKAYLTLNFEMPLLGTDAHQRLEAFDVGMNFLIEGANMVLTDLHGSGYPVAPQAKER